MMPHESSKYNSKVDLQNLEPEHYAVIDQAISTILSTKLASETFAQVVDGIPTRDVHKEYYGYRRRDYNDNICSDPLAVQAVELYRRDFNIDFLQVDAKVQANNA